MSAISDYAGRVNTAFDGIAKSVDGLVGDVKFLKDEIQKLQNSSGTVSAEDQASLDALEARTNALAEKLSTLDAATEVPPTPPTEPPTTPPA